jgi:putrescine aminotransferase
VLIGRRVLELADGGAFMHGFTYNGHPVAAVVALENLNIIEREGLIERGLQVGEWIAEGLRPLDAMPRVRQVRHLGSLFGIETTVSDTAPVQAGCRADGVIVRAMQNFIVLSPPLVMSEDEAATLTASIVKRIAALGG